MAVSVIIICETRGLIWRLGHTLPRLFCLRFQSGDLWNECLVSDVRQLSARGGNGMAGPPLENASGNQEKEKQSSGHFLKGLSGYWAIPTDGAWSA